MAEGTGPRGIGLVATDHLASGVVEGNRLAGSLHSQPEDFLYGLPADALVEILAAEVERLAGGKAVDGIGLALPGIIREGVVEDSPNLHQLKGIRIEALLREKLAGKGIEASLAVTNDADAVAAGLTAIRDLQERPIRVWTLGSGIGFGHHPRAGGIWEGGHTVVSLDPNENLCACGGRGHLEGIMGHRAMRLRFLDREPEEVFAAARSGEDPRCAEFALLWHRALAAATATSIHLEGAGKFYISGTNARFVNVEFLNRCVQEMVKLTPLLKFVFEVVPQSDEVAVVGAAVSALRAE
jgi:predicted NBD/HSP70 family sugar kinase